MRLNQVIARPDMEDVMVVSTLPSGRVRITRQDSMYWIQKLDGSVWRDVEAYKYMSNAEYHAVRFDY